MYLIADFILKKGRFFMKIKQIIVMTISVLTINLYAISKKALDKTIDPVRNPAITSSKKIVTKGTLYCAPIYESVTITQKNGKSLKISVPQNGVYQLMWKNGNVKLDRGSTQVNGQQVTTLPSSSGPNLRDKQAKTYEIDFFLTPEQEKMTFLERLASSDQSKVSNNQLTCAEVDLNAQENEDDVIKKAMGTPEQIVAKYKSFHVYKGFGDPQEDGNYYNIVGDETGIISITDMKIFYEQMAQ